MGGEKVHIISLILARVGSPPRRRGKDKAEHLVQDHIGITPAQAGKSSARFPHRTSARDHPRIGGEKCTQPRPAPTVTGSPPHRRGKDVTSAQAQSQVGITPAWAGKSSAARGCGKAHLDHPRMGGEKADIDDDGLHYKGSPPRGRGKGGDIVGGLGCVRITPAWAGKSLFCFTAAVPIQDHPRIGGEKGLGSQVTQLSQGSPPRRRGKDAVVAVVVRGAGITPAWAGKRLKRSHRSGIFISGPIPFHSVLHRPAGSGSSRAGRDGSPAGQPQNAGPA